MNSVGLSAASGFKEETNVDDMICTDRNTE